MSDEAIDARITTKRAELETTLDAIEDKLNVPKQMNRLSTKAKKSYDDQPLPWIIGATAAAIVIAGTVAWALFSDD
jgi:Flp pilus assembly protein TadB